MKQAAHLQSMQLQTLNLSVPVKVTVARTTCALQVAQQAQTHMQERPSTTQQVQHHMHLSYMHLSSSSHTSAGQIAASGLACCALRRSQLRPRANIVTSVNYVGSSFDHK
jgi:hypothetical protein